MSVEKRIAITTDCVCDLPDDVLDAYGVEIIYFDIKTDHGCFKDRAEITSRNVVEYFEGGGQLIRTEAPCPREFEEFFEKRLETCDEILHITISSCLSASYKYATRAAGKFGGRVKVFDSKHLSTGIGHIVIKAAEMVKEGKSIQEILPVLEAMILKVSTSFIAQDAEYLYRTGRVSRFVKVMCETFKIRPVLGIRNGELRLKTIQIGNYEKSAMRYIQQELRYINKINKKRLFITQACCTVKIISLVKKLVKEKCEFEQTLVTNASATITSNCGSNTFGLLFVEE